MIFLSIGPETVSQDTNRHHTATKFKEKEIHHSKCKKCQQNMIPIKSLN